MLALELPTELQVLDSDKIQGLRDERERRRGLGEYQKLLVGRVQEDLLIKCEPYPIAARMEVDGVYTSLRM